MQKQFTLKERRENKLVYHLMTLPAAGLTAAVVLIPAIDTIYSSFTKWNGVSSTKTWIGLQNYIDIFNDWVFWKAVGNNFIWMFLFLTIPVVIGMLTAVLMAHYKAGIKTFQSIYLIPYLLAPTTNAVIWLDIIFSGTYGIFGYLRTLGLDISSPLGNMKTALYGVAAVDIWHYWGFLTVVFLAALRQTPTDQIESAKLDGANGWQTFFHIYLPNIMPTVLMMLVFIVIYSFKTYDYIHVMTTGGPAHASEVLSTYSYTLAFSAFKFGTASAVSVVIGIFGAVAAFFYTWFSRKETLA